MKRKYIVALFLFVLFCAGELLFAAFQRNAGIRFAQQMGAGINLGNSLDVKKVKDHNPEADIEYFQTYWGNPLTTKEMIDAIAQKGFGTIRIPVSWGEHMDESGNVDKEWMSRVEEVVDWSLEAGMYVILDTHHEEWLMPTPEQEEKVTKKLCALWTQIADTFADRGENLLFEGMNEPRVRDSDEEWKGGSEETKQVVNRLNAAFVRTVREAGGENENRWLLIAPYGNSYEEHALADLEIPDDDRIMVAVHAYIPYSFTRDEDGEQEFDLDDSKECKKITDVMERLEQTFIKKGIPVIITEYGCNEKDDDEERRKWTAFYLEQAKASHIPCIWWDNGSDIQIFDREKQSWPWEELTDIILQK